MKTLVKISLLLAIAAVAAAAAPASAPAAASCHTINAKGIGKDNGDLTTNAQIIGGGLLQGTTAAAFTPTGFVFRTSFSAERSRSRPTTARLPRVSRAR